MKKIIFRIIIGLVIVLVLYFGYKIIFPAPVAVHYVTAAAQRGTIVVSVDGSGQVSASNQIDLKPNASGNVTYIGVSQGQEVKAGALLVKLDTTDAEKAVRDAQVNLQSAQLDLQKLEGPAGLTVPRNKQDAQTNLAQAYDNGFNSISSTFADLPAIMTGLNNLFFGSDKTLNATQQNIDYYATAVKNYDQTVLQYRDDVSSKYTAARTAYDQNFNDYQSANRNSDTTIIENLINETYATTKAVADAIQSGYNLIQFYKDQLTQRNLSYNPTADTHITSLNTYTNQINSHLSDLLNIINTIKTDKDAVANSDLDIQSQQLTIQQRQNALLDAQQNLDNYYVRAPFDGVVAAINVKVGDAASSGTSVVTFITSEKIAEIPLNEVDVSKIKVGQQATLTFDALPDLTIAGKVEEIDTIGTVSQGVVNYNIQIGFATQDSRVKPGMSVSAAIITDVRQNVITVPNAAVKSTSNGSYVQLLQNNQPVNQTVQTGLSNDTVTEIVSGLNEGDQVVTQTVTGSGSSSNSTTRTQNSSPTFRIPGLGGGR